MFLLFLIVVMTAPPLLNSVLEEKMSRISEVLLGSVTPFELMAGKLLSSTAVSVILSLVYLSGAAVMAQRWGYLDAIEPRMVAWFIGFLLLSVLTFGSIFIALGSACSDLRDAQSLMTPAMMLMMLPAFTWTAVLRAPQSGFAIGASLFPLATPFLMFLRLSLPERPPAWQLRARGRPLPAHHNPRPLGRWPHRPRRTADAGQGRQLCRTVDLDPQRLSSETTSITVATTRRLKAAMAAAARRASGSLPGAIR